MPIARPRLCAPPFSSYSQKALIALYKNRTPFDYRNLEEPQANDELGELWPMRRFPVLVDGDRVVIEVTCVIEYLDLHYPGPVKLIPAAPDSAIEVRMLDRFFDNDISTPQQKIVFDRLRPESPATPTASNKPAPCSTPRTRDWTSAWRRAYGLPARTSRWPTAPPRPFSSMPTGPTRSTRALTTSTPTANSYSHGLRSSVPWTKRDRTVRTSRLARRIGIEGPLPGDAGVQAIRASPN